MKFTINLEALVESHTYHIWHLLVTPDDFIHARASSFYIGEFVVFGTQKYFY